MGRTRREFICESTALLAGTALLVDASSRPAAAAAGVSWPIGCLNRPWTKWTFDETLKAIAGGVCAPAAILLARVANEIVKQAKPSASTKRLRSGGRACL